MEKEMVEFEQQLMQLVTGKWLAQPIKLVVELGIPDLLDDAPLSCAALAEQCGCQEKSLYRVLRALAAWSVFHEEAGKVFSLAPLGACLCRGRMREVVRMFLSDWHDAAWGRLDAAVKGGEIPFEIAHKRDAFAWLAKHPRAASAYHGAQAWKAANTARFLIQAFDFSPVRDVTDVGGGSGALIAAVLEAHPHLQGCVAEQPGVLAQARVIVKEQYLSGRCRLVACDFLDSVPGGSDCYLLANVLHDWDDARCRTILGNCQAAMGDGGFLLVLEMFLPPCNQPSVVPLLDLEMLVMGNGRERTRQEYCALLDGCGFRVEQCSEDADLGLLVGVPA